MALFNFGKAKPVVAQNIAYISGKANAKTITEAFKGEVVQDKVQFPNELGVEHPFDFCTLEKLYCDFGFVTGVVNKYVNHCIAGFWVHSDNQKAQDIIEQWIEDVNFITELKNWTKEAILKGNGFLEVGNTNELKILSANYMYVNRDDKGNILGYNQYLGSTNKFTRRNIIQFKDGQIAHLKLNIVGDSAYGYGYIAPAMKLINDYIGSRTELHTIMKRKANSPIVAKIGDLNPQNPIIPTQSEIDAFGDKLTWLNNQHEWAVGPAVNMSVLDFGNIGDKFASILDNDSLMLIYAFQVPEVLMGSGKIPEGLAGVQMEDWQLTISSIQAEIEKVVEQKIFRKVLQNNGMDAHVEFEWGTPSKTDKNARITLLKDLLSSPGISSALNTQLQMDLAEELGYDITSLEQDIEDEKEEDAANLEREKEENEPQPKIPGSNEFYNHKITESVMTQEHEITEWVGFNYQKYLDKIIEFIAADSFDFLAAKSLVEEQLGYLTSTQVAVLKDVLTEGFTDGKSIQYIAKRIKNDVKPKDLIVVDDTNTIQRIISKEQRNIMIARTETIRAANAGALETYQEAGVEKVRFIAAISDRTCPTCESLNGTIYNINEAPEIPVHVMCRCTYAPQVELK